MKAGIFDPYLDTIGGGERYAMTVAETLLGKGWQVDIFWPDRNIEEKLKQKFGLKIERVNYVNYSPKQNNLLKRCKFERKYDILFYFSDGSIPFMFGKNNMLHFQVPFKNVLKKSFNNWVKLETIRTIVCNSFFTKKIIDQSLGVKSLVIYPPIDIKPIKKLKKENIILSVGRFSQLLQSKRQDVLINCFKKIIDEGKASGWKLVLAGGSEVGGREFLEKLKMLAQDYPVEIRENPPFTDLVELYGKAKLFWAAPGFGINETDEPERVEHFGMTTVEAMAGGCVPIVQAKGGQKEIVVDGQNGYLWLEEEELAEKSIRLIADKIKLDEMSQKAIERSKCFSKEIFYNNFEKLIHES